MPLGPPVTNASDTKPLVGRTILQVIPELETGGAERTTLEVAEALIAAGAKAIVVSEGGRLVEPLEKLGATHITLPVASKNPWRIWLNRDALFDLIREHHVDIIHVRSRAPAWSALWAARAAKIPFVTTYHGIYSAKTAAKRLYNSAMARGDVVIANSAYTAQTVVETFGKASFFDAERVRVIPRGADLERFDPRQVSPARRDAAVLAFGGDHEAFRVLLPGRLTAWKGQRELIAAAGLLQRKGRVPSMRIVLLGGAQGRDDYEAELLSMIDAEGLANTVHLHGHWDDMAAAYLWADVAVSASTRPEAFGRVAAEASAMGVPVIATAHGGSLETVVDGTTGWLVTPGDPEGLADALEEACEAGATRRHAMGQAGRDRIRQHFSTKAMTDATLSVYIGLMSAGSGETSANMGGR